MYDDVFSSLLVLLCPRTERSRCCLLNVLFVFFVDFLLLILFLLSKKFICFSLLSAVTRYGLRIVKKFFYLSCACNFLIFFLVKELLELFNNSILSFHFISNFEFKQFLVFANSLVVA
jgi:hypothetical protein